MAKESGPSVQHDDTPQAAWEHALPLVIQEPLRVIQNEAAEAKHFFAQTSTIYQHMGFTETASHIEETLMKTRATRVDHESQAPKPNFIQGAFRTGIGWVARTAIEAIPSPFLWGIGDAATLASALRGQDIFTGEPLDLFDQRIYLLATVIPFIPATLLIEPAKGLRRFTEDAVHAIRTRSLKPMAKHVNPLRLLSLAIWKK